MKSDPDHCDVDKLWRMDALGNSPEAVLDDPEFLPYQIDFANRRVLFLRLSATERGATFLGEHLLGQARDGAWLPLSAVLEAAKADAQPLWLFHIGHCGSTLLSRLLECWPRVFALREPLPLRDLASAQLHLDLPYSHVSEETWRRSLQAVAALWARPAPNAARAVVKASSGCNGLIEPLIARSVGARALLLEMPLVPYLTAVLKSATSLRDVANAAPTRIAYLQRLTGDSALSLHAMEWPEMAAMGWLAEHLRFRRLAQAYPEQTLCVDFEQLLATPRAVLAAIAAHYTLEPSGIDTALHSSHWKRYAKATEHPYSKADRDHDLALSKSRNAGAIERGTQWLDRFLARHSELVM